MRVPLFAARRAIPVALTLSGNEITDATRAAGVQGDGLSGDGSFGIYELTTNLVTNGGFETNTAGWSSASVTLERITTDAKFGTACGRVSKTALAGSAEYIQTAFITVTASTAYTVSAWVKKVTATNTGALLIAWYTAADAYVGLSTFYFAAGTHGWTRYTGTATAPGTAGKARVLVSTDGATPGSDYDVYVDGVQLEQKPVATPYRHTDGGTGFRDRAQVQVPASVLSAAQGFVAMRWRMGYPASETNTRCFALIGTDTNNRLGLFANSGGVLSFIRIGGGTRSDANRGGAAWTNVGDCITVIAYWTPTTITVSLNGESLATWAVAQSAIPPLPALWDIGADTFNLANRVMDSSVFWVLTGKGTLTDATAVLLHSFGNADPNPRLIPPSARLTGGWGANNGIMRTYVA